MKREELTKMLLTIVAIFTLQGVAVAQTELPYTNGLDTEDSLNDFTTIDANGDDSTWIFYENTTVCYRSSSIASDDWLISPQLKTSDGIVEVSFDSYISYENIIEKFEVYLMPSNTDTGSAIKISETIEVGNTAVANYLFACEIPSSLNGEFYVAIRAVSDVNRWRVNIANFKVESLNGVVLGATTSGSGTVSINGATTQTSATKGVEIGGSATFIATANTGYSFVNWTDADGNEVSDQAEYTISSVSTSVELTANFEVMMYDLPYSNDFNTTDAFNEFTVIDENGDGYSWRSYGTASCVTTNNNGANDWLISPLFKVDGTDIDISFSSSCSSASTPQKFEVYILGSDMDTANAIKISETITVESTSSVSYSYSYNLSEFGESFYVAIKCVSDAGLAYLYINSFEVVYASGSVDLPYSNNFDTEDSFNEFTVIDENGDGYSWGSYGTAACVTTNNNGANDWLISPLFKVDGTDIAISFSSSCSSASTPQKFEVYILGSDMDTANAIKISETITVESTSSVSYSYSYNLSEFGESFYVAIKCVSDAGLAYLFINSFEVVGYDNGVIVSATASGNGVVAINGSDYLSSAMALVEVGDDVTFMAYADVDAAFVNWTDADGNVVSTDAEYTIVSVSTSVSLTANFITYVVEDKYIYADTEENGDAVYGDVIIDAICNWNIGNNNIVADFLLLPILEDGSATQILIGSEGSLSVGFVMVFRLMDEEHNALMSLPFAFNLADLSVNSGEAVYGDNIKIYTYDAAKRAAESTEGYTVSGWEEIITGTIEANQGFAVAVNADNGYDQYVIFGAYNMVFTGEDKTIYLDRHESDVNDGADADWNFYGNPMLQSVDKTAAYSLYQYDAANNTYIESAAVESSAYIPYAGVFAQSSDGFESVAFSAASSVSQSTIEINGTIKLSINGDDDVAKMFIVEGSSADYVTNEDAMYFAGNNSSLAQIYFIDHNGRSIASTVIPAIVSTTVAYKAATAGAQSIAMSTDVTGVALYLQDAVTGESVLMTDGTIYEFESEAGTFTSRFTLVAESETTAIEGVEASDVKVVVSNGYITIIGAEIGDDIAIFGANGVMLYSGVVTSAKETIAISATGVVVVKVDNTVIKVICGAK